MEINLILKYKINPDSYAGIEVIDNVVFIEFIHFIFKLILIVTDAETNQTNPAIATIQNKKYLNISRTMTIVIYESFHDHIFELISRKNPTNYQKWK